MKRSWLKRRTALKRVSDKRRRENRVYLKLRKVFLEENPICQMRVKCDGAPSTQVHHTRGRGIWYLIVKYWKASCLDCHDWENTHRNQAVALGLRERIYRNDSSVICACSQCAVLIIPEHAPLP